MDANVKLRFFESAYERQKIYIRKDVLHKSRPWTDNITFQSFFFCNVFRTLDKTTIWIKDHIIDVYENEPDLWKRIVMARHLSRVSTLNVLERANAFGDQKLLTRILESMWRNGEPIHTGAFVINPSSGDENLNKYQLPEYVVRTLEREWGANLGELIHKTNSLETAHQMMMVCPGTGGFMAYEYVTDFSYTNTLLGNAMDTYTWSNPGPGARRGMRRIINGNAIEPVYREEEMYKTFSKELLSDWKAYVEKTLMSVIDEFMKDERVKEDYDLEAKVRSAFHMFDCITMREVEHWLCEFDKYERGGSSKRRYMGV